MAALAEEPPGAEASSSPVGDVACATAFQGQHAVLDTCQTSRPLAIVSQTVRSTFTASEASIVCDHGSGVDGGNKKGDFVLSAWCTLD